MEIKINTYEQGLRLITFQIVSNTQNPIIVSIQGPLELGVNHLGYDASVNLERACINGWTGTTNESQNIVKLAEINTAGLQYFFIKDPYSSKRIDDFSKYFLRRPPDVHILMANPFNYSKLNTDIKINLRKGFYNLIIEGNPKLRLRATSNKDFF